MNSVAIVGPNRLLGFDEPSEHSFQPYFTTPGMSRLSKRESKDQEGNDTQTDMMIMSLDWRSPHFGLAPRRLSSLQHLSLSFSPTHFLSLSPPRQCGGTATISITPSIVRNMVFFELFLYCFSPLSMLFYPFPLFSLSFTPQEKTIRVLLIP